MQLRYVFSELGQGLRRNLSMHIAVLLTLLVSLTLVGLGLLFNKQAQKATDYWGSQLEITVWLCKDKDPTPACASQVTTAQRDAIIKVVQENPEVAGYRTESQQTAFDKAKDLLGSKYFEGDNPPLTVEAMRESVWIELKDPEKFEGITSAVQGLDGVSEVRDAREQLKPILASIKVLKYASWITAGVLVLAALLLVGNTIRLAAMARRREIGIMRLVGASTLYITLPFLLEALVTALVSAMLAGGVLAAFMKFAIIDRAGDQLKFIPWIHWDAYGQALAVIAILAPVLTMLPTLVLTRKYLKV